MCWWDVGHQGFFPNWILWQENTVSLWAGLCAGEVPDTRRAETRVSVLLSNDEATTPRLTPTRYPPDYTSLKALSATRWFSCVWQGLCGGSWNGSSVTATFWAHASRVIPPLTIPSVNLIYLRRDWIWHKLNEQTLKKAHFFLNCLFYFHSETDYIFQNCYLKQWIRWKRSFYFFLQG